MATLYSAEMLIGVTCNECGEKLMDEDGDALMELCGEPFNGTILECPNDECPAEYDLSLRIAVEQI